MSPLLAAALGVVAVLAAGVAASGGPDGVPRLGARPRRPGPDGRDHPALARGGRVAAVGRSAARRARGRRADARLTESLPTALDVAARALRSGASLAQALDAAAAAPVGSATAELAVVARRADAGVGLVGSLERWADERPLPAVRLTVAAVLVGAETGAPPARAVDAVAATLRERRAAEREAEAQATQARASVALLVAAPPLFAVFASLIDPRVGALLVGEPLGWALLGVGLGLDAVGAAWMARLVRAAR